MRTFINVLGVVLRGAATRPYEVATLVLSALALTIATLLFLGMKAGLTRALLHAGSDRLVLVLGNGAESEVTSALAISEVNRIIAAARLSTADDLVFSPELYATLRVPAEKSGETEVVAVRGLARAGLTLRRNFRIVEGRLFGPTRRELIVGRELAQRLPGPTPGGTIAIGDRIWRIVGVFDADETTAESELFGGATLLQDDLHRQGTFQSLRIAKKNGGDVSDVIDRIEGNLSGGASFRIMRETEYYREEIRKIESFMNFVSIPIISILFLAVLSASTNSMYVIGRSFQRDMAIMRSLGFSRSILSRSVFLVGYVFGLAGMFSGIAIGALSIDDYGASITSHAVFSEVFFKVRIDGRSIALSVLVSTASSVAGSTITALGLGRMTISRALQIS